MALNSKIVNDTTFLWKIENFTERTGAYISPSFTSKCLDGTQWFLELFINKCGPENSKFINIFLNRAEGEECFLGVVDFTITILSNDVSSNIYRKSISNVFNDKNMYNGFRKIVSKEELYAKRNVYLPDDILSVECYIEEKVRGSTIALNSEIPETLQRIDCNIKGLGNDLLQLYLDSKFCDIKISTIDRTFSVHKSVICARSPVFNAMFENDTKEKNSGVVDVTDVDSTAMNHLLMYMYSDIVEDMDPKETEKVYAVADKYGVLPLKHHCSSTLKSLISDANFTDIYILADMHQDGDLMIAVEGYVFKYMNNIFKSPELKQFMQLSPQLSAELMHKVWIMLLGE